MVDKTTCPNCENSVFRTAFCSVCGAALTGAREKKREPEKLESSFADDLLAGFEPPSTVDASATESTGQSSEKSSVDFVDEMGATFPIVLDEDGEVSKTYQVRGLPTSIFVDRDGIVNEIFTGPINKAYIEAKLNEL